MAHTVSYTIGKQTIGKISVPLQPEKFILRDHLVETRILGVPITYKDENVNKVLYSTSPDANQDYKSDVKPEYDGSNVVLNLNMKFVERMFIIHFYSVGDILSKLGGLRASIMPILSQFTPFFVIYFLFLLVGVIQRNIRMVHGDAIKEYIAKSKLSLDQIIEA